MDKAFCFLVTEIKKLAYKKYRYKQCFINWEVTVFGNFLVNTNIYYEISYDKLETKEGE